MSAQQSNPDADAPDQRRWRAFIVVLAAGFMTLLDVSIVNVALPSIEAGLGATASHIQWIVAGYSLAFGLSLVPAGRLGDVFGRRRLFLIGLVGFVVASAACGFAQDSAMLAAMRIVQGLFAGVMNPQVIALIQELFRGPERAKAFGWFGMTIGVSTAIGPMLGGILVSGLGPEYGWRSVFLINVPIGLAVIPLAARFLPSLKRSDTSGEAAPARPTRTKLGLDAPGLVLIGGIVLAIMWPFVSGSEREGDLSSAPWWMLGVALALVGVLIAWEGFQDRRGRPVVLPRSLVRNRGFVMGACLGAVFFAGFSGMFIVITMYYQQGLGLPAWVSGLSQMPFAVASAIAAARSGARVNVKGRAVVTRGLVTMATGLLGVVAVALVLPQDVGAWIIPAFLFVAGWGSGFVISPNQALTLADVPTEQAGTASGMLQTLQRLGGSVGLALVTTVFFTRVAVGHGSPESYSQALVLSTSYTILMVLIATIIAVADSRRRSH